MSPLEQYFQELRDIRASGATVKETSYYGPLANFLTAIGSTLKPKVRCLMQLKNLGAGMPDGGLFTARQFQRESGDLAEIRYAVRPNEPQNPERGVIEVKGTGDDAWVTASSQQVSKYWDKYRQVLVTNYRDFVLVGQDINGRPITLETYRLANSEKEFWQKVQKSRVFAQEQEEQLTEYLKRVMLQPAAIATPQDLAWFLASYAKDARARIEKFDLPALQTIRTGLEGALGITFTAQKGEKFFKSTLIQTLFYGVFSAWVLWHKQGAKNNYFDWKTSAWSLHVPMVKALFEKVATPSNLGRLDLVEVLDWTGEALNRVDRNSFFAQFDEGLAVQYFYEPFLEAFDPQLRKDLGVWYTPPEIVQYMVARVDTVLKKELGIANGLADENVYILDPCCGTGAFLVEVLKHIHQTLIDNGEDALGGAALKAAAKNRIFGFEILTAPFVVAHLQLGVLLQNLGVPLQDETERVGIYLTNALTGWQPPNEQAKERIQQLELAFPELNQEREAADEVKRGKPILVILGNPPYNAYAGTSPAEEEGLVDVYKQGLIKEWGIKKFNLDDLYVRFLRLAERCISEHTGKGIVCYISNFSYLGDSSFVVMRQKFLQEFDQLYFDCLNGDSRETGKVTPDGKPDPSVFSTQYNKAGIRVGTTIALMVRKNTREKKSIVNFQHFWGVNKNQAILNSLSNQNFDLSYQQVIPHPNNRFSFRPSEIEPHYLEWPKVTDFCAVEPSNGLMEKRGGALMDLDRNALAQRMQAYFDSNLDWDDYKALNYGLVKPQASFEPKLIRRKAILEDSFDSIKIVRYALRPFDFRWCYYTPVSGVWNRSRPPLWKQCWQGNKFLLTRFNAAKNSEGTPFYFTPFLSDDHLLTPDAIAIPFQLMNGARLKAQARLILLEMLGEKPEVDQAIANLSLEARQYLKALNCANPDQDTETACLIWYHALAIGYSSSYLTENIDGIRQDFPRIPLPDSRELLIHSAQLGQKLAQLLDPENQQSIPEILANLKQVAVISHVNNQQLNPDSGDLTINVGWGHSGKQGVTMPGKGKFIERVYSEQELTYFQETLKLNSEQVNQLLGKVTYDIYLNEIAYWKNIPQRVWDYTIGGYQVIKKWLSYRETTVLGRHLKLEEVREVQDIARRITAILLLEPELNANYQAVKQSTYNWSDSSS